ncbi:MAG: KdsC family phosphatase [Acidobacteriota bacterium]
MKISPALKRKIKKIRLIMMDIDGVMTDGTLFMGPEGEEYKGFNSRDGHGVRMGQRAGLGFGILTGRESDVVRHRAANLGIDIVIQKSWDKGSDFLRIVEKLHLQPAEVAFVGDDVVDIPAMLHSGLGVAVADAQPEVKKIADYTTSASGGRGAVREVIELIMKTQGTWEEEMKRYRIK